MCEVVRALVGGGAKAARVARACRTLPPLADLLVQRKSIGEANPRFFDDFKTLADVLIQEALRYDLAERFPQLAEHIHGEECADFTNSLGVTVSVSVRPTEEETAQLLCTVLAGDAEAARLLAKSVHEDVPDEDDVAVQIGACLSLDVAVDEIGVWIDPIDSTAEYIRGDEEGLRCVTVLIGVYHLKTGRPLIGVVHQPFYTPDVTRCVWGVSYMGTRIYCNPIREPEQPEGGRGRIVCVSQSDSDAVKSTLVAAGYELMEAAGAGHKILMVILDRADAYVLSKPTTFKWDTCGPHAVLNSLQGGIVDYAKVVSDGVEMADAEITYEGPEKCNTGGIIAYRNVRAAEAIIKILSSNRR